MSESLDVRDPASLAAEYLEIKARIEDMEQRAQLIKDNLVGLLPYTEGFSARYGPATVLWAKGRRTEKVDPKAVRRELVLAGVDANVIEKAFTAATTVSVGNPTMRVCKTEED